MLNKPETTAAALENLRKLDNFNWMMVICLAFVLYVYMTAIENKKWKQIAAGLALYGVHWFVEIVNALIQHFSGHALWTASGGTTFLILIGVGIEISFMFSVSGLILSKVLPEDKNMKMLGINNRIFLAVVNAFLVALIEIPLAASPIFHWVYPWWGMLTVWIFIYIPFFLAAFLCYDARARTNKIFLGSLYALNLIMMLAFIPLGWI
ncbi:hypothetical protein [Oceanispirochaeta sp.]|uniref:hypothetical protein n=1 Tax=Oceanispirochaeta sp. TaxID=2035350 RepID=UPI00262BD2BE|nr:hypothetical protein [Oceanispirochaeta sp.]MDA3956021.1 hypothetical protein [Oceanispirochaeta sp.]